MSYVMILEVGITPFKVFLTICSIRAYSLSKVLTSGRPCLISICEKGDVRASPVHKAIAITPSRPNIPNKSIITNPNLHNNCMANNITPLSSLNKNYVDF